MPRARTGRRQADKDDEWASDSTVDDLPDWLETDESHLEDLRRDLLAQPRTRRDVMHHPAILRRCHFRPLSALSRRLQRLIISKLQRLEDSLPYADEALEAPARVHVLLWLPPTPAASPGSQDAADDHDLPNLTQLVDATDLRRTRLAEPQRRVAAAASAAASPGPEPDPHLLGFCLLARRRDPASGGRYNTIEFFNTLVNGYNFGQLLFERAGELCRCSHPATVGAATAAADAAAPAASTLASWPLPSAPKNIFYWIKLERIPALGSGGMLRAFAAMRLAATAAAVPALDATAPGDGGSAEAAPSGGSTARNRSAGGGSRPRSAAAVSALRRGGGRTPPLLQRRRPGAEAAAAAAGAGAGAADNVVGELLAAFRHFCVQELSWEPVEVEAYLQAVGGEEGAAVLLAAAAAAAAARTAAPGKDGESAEPPAAAMPAVVMPKAGRAPSASATAASPPAQQRRRQQTQVQRQGLQSQRRVRGAAAAAAFGGPYASESSFGCCVGGAAAVWRGPEVGRWALFAAGRGRTLRPLPAPVPRLPTRRHASGTVRCYSSSSSRCNSGNLSHSGRGALFPKGCAPGPSAGRMRPLQPSATHGSVSLGAGVRRLVL